MKYFSEYYAPLSKILLISDGESLTGLYFCKQKYLPDNLKYAKANKNLEIFKQTKHWLDLYFSGISPNFTPALKFIDTEFRMQIWNFLLTIPFGQTITYGKIAKVMAEKRGIKKMSAQAIGGAVAHNPIAIIVPCHRVLGTRNKLTGYAGGLDKKKWLLKNEKIYFTI